MEHQGQKSYEPLSATLVAILVLPVLLGAWGRFGLKVPSAMILSLTTALIIRFYGKNSSNNFPWALFWLFSLFIPLGMPLWLVPVSLLAGWLIAVSAFGGAGKNIFNPIAVALVFLQTGYGSAVSLVAAKPFPGATSAFKVWTAGMNSSEPSMLIWLGRQINSWPEYFAGGHLPSIPGLAFPGIMLAMVALLVVFVPGRRWWFAFTLIFTCLASALVYHLRPASMAGIYSVFSLGSYPAILLLIFADTNALPEKAAGQVLFSLVLSPFMVLFICTSLHDLAPAFALLLTQALFPLLCDLTGVDA